MKTALIAACLISTSAFADSIPDYIDFGGAITANVSNKNDSYTASGMVDRYGATWKNVEINWFGDNPSIDVGAGVVRLIDRTGKTPFVGYVTASYFPFIQSGVSAGFTVMMTTAKQDLVNEFVPMPTVCVKYACVMASLPVNSNVTTATITFRVPVGL